MNHLEEIIRQKAEQKLRQDPGLISRKDEATIEVDIHDKNESDEFMLYKYKANYKSVWNSELKINEWSFVSYECTSVSPLIFNNKIVK